MVIDGQVHELSIDTTMGSVLGMGAIPATPCDDSPVSIDAGSHTLDTLSSDDGVFVVRSVGLDPVDDGTSGPPARTVAVESWSGERRAVRVGPGEESYLAVSENENAGWRATLDGQELRSVKLDGWKQGFVVPAGEGGLVTMTYAPTGGYRVALVAGALLVFGLMAMALVGARRAPPPSLAEGRIPWWLLVAATVVAGIALGGPLVLLVLPVFVLGRWRAASLGLLAGGSFALAAILVAWSRTGGHPAVIGSTGWVPTTLTVLALLAVAVSVVLPSVARRGSSDPDASAPDLNIQGETP